MWVFALALGLIAAAITYGWWWYTYGDGRFVREKEAAEQAARLARIRARGWFYEAPDTGDIKYRIEGRTEANDAWMLHYDSDHSSSSSSPKLVFTSKVFNETDEVWHIHDSKSYALTQKRAMKFVISGLAAVIGKMHDGTARKARFFEESHVQPAGSRAFQARYVLVSIDRKWKTIVSEEVERKILTWPDFRTSMTWRDNALSASLGPDGLRVELYVDSPSFEVIVQMVELGQLLTVRTRMIQHEML